VIPGITVNATDGLFVPSVALTLNVPASDAGTLNAALEKPPVELVVTVAGTVVRAVVGPNLNVIVFDGARWMPDTEIVAPTWLVVELSINVGVTLNANGAVGELVPSDARTVLLPPAVTGTVNVVENVPDDVDVTVATVAPLNLIITECVGTDPVPVTVIICPGTPVDADSEIEDGAIVITVEVNGASFAWNRNGPVNGLIIVYVPVKPPVADDVITAGVVIIFEPSLTVKWNDVVALNPVPVNDIVVPLDADAGVSVIAEAIWNDVDALLVPSVALTM
jgi:hypothetical protein